VSGIAGKHVSTKTEDIPGPHRDRNAALPSKIFPIGKGLSYAVECDDEEPVPLGAKIAVWLNSNLTFFRDDVRPWSSPQVAEQAMDAAFGKLFPKADVDWLDAHSDEATWRWVSQGVAAQRLVRLQPGEGTEEEAGGFVVRHEHMQSLETRKAYARYGGDAYFTAEGRLTRIVFHGKEYRPGDPRWTYVKYAFRSSGFLWASMADHLGRCHFGWANWLSLTVGRCFDKNHPMRRFIKPFAYKTVNLTYVMTFKMFNPNGFMHRVTGLTWTGMQAMLDEAVQEYRYERYPDELRRKGVHPDQLTNPELYPFGLESTAAYADIARYVDEAFEGSETLRSMVNDAQTAAWWKELRALVRGDIGDLTLDNLKDALKTAFFTVSFYHWHVQGISAFIRNPEVATMRLVDGQTIGDQDGGMCMAAMTCVTGLPLPTIAGDFSGQMPDDGTKAAAKALSERLHALETAMRARNANRKQGFILLYPSVVATSVGI
jgi:hypothetical protein